MKQAERRKFHYIYKITRNDGSGKYYIGMHSTDDLEDGYFGSGQLLWKSIAKHGKEIHSKEIMEFLPSRRELKIRERELVNEEIVNDPLCMNLKLGGEGGGKIWSSEHLKRFQEGAKLANFSSARNRAESTAKRNRTLKASGKIDCFRSFGFRGSKHSDVSKTKISESMQGKQDLQKNSQFGTCWVTNGVKPIKIKKEELDEYLAKGYRRGRK